MSILETQISFYNHFSDTTAPINGNFLQIVTSKKLEAKYAANEAQIRATTDEATRKLLKKNQGCFTVSGTFKHRSASGLISHSGLIQFDIDPKENPFLNSQTAPQLREQISHLEQVAYCALSVSWAGVWGVVPIAEPNQHKAHFAALAADFAGYGITIDAACSNVVRLRYWSHDPNAYFNHSARIYTKQIFPKADNYTPRQFQATTDNGAKVEAILGQMFGDITAGGNGYEDWFAIGCALANEFGEAGRDYFHRISRYHAKYSYQETEKQYTACLRNPGGGITLGTFFEIAKRYGLTFKHHLPTPTTTQAHTPPPTTTQATQPHTGLPQGHRREQLTDRTTGRPIAVVLNAHGYPASWDQDLEPTQRASLAHTTEAHPDTTELILRFDLRLDKGEFDKPWEQWERESAERHARARKWYPGAYGLQRPTANAIPAHMAHRMRKAA